ncbi:hypothetical protein [Halalkalibacter hemicellulosilyticus]|uniref:Uncharacterized protein n=1 Tax=Halalkalibacter hemicellulosilyticusJCM 9152 TaxID=1236971 RepID=W4QGJ8_9BACI|nr:hypothetical protein [Halalkalibacter hemicellulosilyticus]GAE31240.1 hypothetical protein JCM9152_2696 [Halalkalibacter hemicellulosilyticusJCM 9152]
MYQNGPPHYNPYNANQQYYYNQQSQSTPPPFQPQQASNQNNKKKPQLSPNTLAVVTALLTNALTVQSVLIDKDKTIQVLLEGSLHAPKKSELDILIDQVRDVPVGDFINSLLNQEK